MALSLRPYQEQIVNQARNLMLNGTKKLLLQSPTGSGKSVIIGHIAKSCESKGMRCWLITHRRELIEQLTKAATNAETRPAIVSAGWPMEDDFLIQVCSISTLQRRYNVLLQPATIIWDECHHAPAKGWQKIFDAFPNAYHIGFTATPCRLDGKGLDDLFDAMVLGPKIDWLINEGWLVPFKYFAPSNLDLTGIKTRMGDYAKGELASVVDNNAIIGDAAKSYKKYCDDKRAIVFCVTVEHSKHVAQSYRDLDIPAWHVDGETPKDERKWAMEQFKAGAIKVLCNVDLFGEGVDVPAVEAVQLLRPTQSLGLFLQQVGRALRPSEGKERAIILDHVSNWTRHGLPDEDRQWSLAGAPDRSREGGSVKQCPKCYNVQPPGTKACNSCGFEFPREGKKREINQVEGELNEVTPEMAQWMRRREQGQAQTLEDLIALGKKRGYRAPERWAQHLFNARQAKRNRGL